MGMEPSCAVFTARGARVFHAGSGNDFLQPTTLYTPIAP